MTYADEPTNEIDVLLASTPTSRRTVRRTLSVVGDVNETEPVATGFPPPDANLNEQPQPRADEEDFSILRLDLNLGAAKNAKALINHLEKASISSLLDNRLSASLDHLDLLRKRIHDAQSRVLITGDLNAGKSTLVNALLRRDEVMPVDEQPLTTRFVEVVNARENEGKEEIHVLDMDKKYDPSDRSTYTVEPITNLEELVSDAETDASQPPLRIYLNDVGKEVANPSILHNGVVDISLIDAPGLNRDSIKTTANFARQEEIDVVVFVVSAANHFTLSAKEFIWQASHEKAHLFIVVNRFDQIKDKERCRRIVLEQIKQLSPKTYEDAADLVHFVDSATVALGFADHESVDDIDAAFSHLEHSLRSFVLVNRSKSKLGPARNYLSHLLDDVELLASANNLVAVKERDVARDEIARIKPTLDKMIKGREGLEESLVAEEERATEASLSRSKQAIERALERVARGELAAPAPGLHMPSYPGLLGVWDYAHEIRRVLLSSLDYAVTLTEDDARRLTADGVKSISAVGDKYLPADVERSQRIFNPAAMFSARPSKSSRRASGVMTVGLGLAGQKQLGEVSISDIIDLEHHLFLARSHLSPSSSSSSGDVVPYAADIGVVSLALGAFSVVNGKVFGVHSLIETMSQISSLASSPAARKWAGPVVGALTLGAVAYVIYELPRSVPRNVGRSLQRTLSTGSGEEGDTATVPFTDAVSTRVSKEVRKVMRLGAWDLRERFKSAVDTRAEMVKKSEAAEKRANVALAHFTDVDNKVQNIRESVADIKI